MQFLKKHLHGCNSSRLIPKIFNLNSVCLVRKCNFNLGVCLFSMRNKEFENKVKKFPEKCFCLHNYSTFICGVYNVSTPTNNSLLLLYVIIIPNNNFIFWVLYATLQGLRMLLVFSDISFSMCSKFLDIISIISLLSAFSNISNTANFLYQDRCHFIT